MMSVQHVNHYATNSGQYDALLFNKIPPTLARDNFYIESLVEIDFILKQTKKKKKKKKNRCSLIFH